MFVFRKFIFDTQLPKSSEHSAFNEGFVDVKMLRGNSIPACGERRFQRRKSDSLDAHVVRRVVFVVKVDPEIREETRLAAKDERPEEHNIR